MKYDLTLTFRNLKRSKVISAINIFGLAIGFSFVILAFRYVYTENTFDKFHRNYRSIFRIEKYTTKNGRSCFNSNIMHSWLKYNFPEISKATRIINDSGFGRQRNLMYNNVKFNIQRPLIVDSDFFDIFSFQILAGDTKSFDRAKNSIALVESFSEKIFGDINPVGKIVTYKNEVYTVTTIIKDIPPNSSIKFDVLLPISNLPEYVTDDWRNNTLQIFILAENNTSCETLQQKINSGVESVFQSLGYAANNEIDQPQYLLNPLDEIYFSDIPNNDICIHGNSTITFLLSSIAILVLMIAVINFVNILLVKVSQRTREIGVRAATGASALDNVRLLLYESIVPCFISALLAIIIIFEIEPLINPLLNIPLVALNFFHFVIIIGSILAISLLAGLYPAIKLSSFSIIESLKRKTQKGKSASYLRGSLSIFQFGASIVLITSLIFIFTQLDFVFEQSKKNLDDNLVLFMSLSNRTPVKNQKIYTIQEALKSLAEVKEVSSCLHLPGDELYSNLGVRFKNGKNNEIEIMVNHNMVDVTYPEVMGFKFLKGRSFHPGMESDNGSYIVNEAFIEKYHVQNQGDAWLNGSPIVGVIKDFHFNSLHSRIEPLAIRYENSYQSRIVIRIASENFTSLAPVVKKINATINAIDNTAVADIQFLDEHIAALYEREIRIKRILSWFTTFSILISCLGLFAMSLFAIQTRTKEIGVRKVFGASVAGLVTKISMEFTFWVILANLFAWPVTYFLIQKWLQNFAYRINITIWPFMIAGFAAFLLAFIAVFYQTIKAALANPIESLRYE